MSDESSSNTLSSRRDADKLTAASRDPLTDLLIRHEGVSLFPYTDTVGKITLGVGRNLTDCGISRAEAFYLLANDIVDVNASLLREYPWCVTLDPVRADVLRSMRFALGSGGLSKFVRFIAALKNDNYTAAADELLTSRWAEQVGGRAHELAAMLLTGARGFRV